MAAAMAETVYTKSELIAVLRDFSREFQIPAVYLFGSYARDEAPPESDVDIVIDSRNIHGLLAVSYTHLTLPTNSLV